jgi:Ca2+-binding EF-hand superfamily protein
MYNGGREIFIADSKLLRGSLHHHEVSNVHPVLDKSNNAKISFHFFLRALLAFACVERDEMREKGIWRERETDAATLCG